MREAIRIVREVFRTQPVELMIAWRYLTATRKQAVIAVISLIAVLGIAAGVAVLVIALALVNGFNQDIREKVLAGTAHLNVMRKDGGFLRASHEVIAALGRVPGIQAIAPTHYEQVFVSYVGHGRGLILKGVDVRAPREANEVWSVITQGSVEELIRGTEDVPGVILGRVVAEELGVKVGEVVTVVSPEGRLTPLGMVPRLERLRVVGLFSSGLYEYDSSWGYIALSALGRMLGTESPVTVLQMKVRDIYRVKEIARQIQKILGPEYTTTDWQELNQPVFAALQLQRVVVVVVLTLMIVIAALNIITSLVMMVVHKTRDISVIRAMGAPSAAILRIFIWQGLLVGVIGTILGLAVGVTLSLLADRYQWIRVPETVFSISAAPFRPRLSDVLIVAGIALLISFVATIYPARSAARLNPVEGLRYE